MWRVYDSAAALQWALAAPLFPENPVAAVAVEAVAAGAVEDVPVDGAYSGSSGGSPVPACRIMVQCSRLDLCLGRITKLRRLAGSGMQH